MNGRIENSGVCMQIRPIGQVFDAASVQVRQLRLRVKKETACEKSDRGDRFVFLVRVSTRTNHRYRTVPVHASDRRFEVGEGRALDGRRTRPIRGLENCVPFERGAVYEPEKTGNGAGSVCCRHRKSVNRETGKAKMTVTG